MVGITTVTVLLITAAMLIGMAAIIPTANAAVPAVFVFGDSIFDVGNNNFLLGNNSKVNHPQYGIDYPGGVATGRFSNGYNGADFLSRLIGFKQSPRPVLNDSQAEPVFRGLNYASGGSGILDLTGGTGSLSLKRQIKYFENTTLNQSADLISQSIFLLNTGSNDMSARFFIFAVNGSINSTRKDKIIDNLSSNLKPHLQKLYDLGARKLVFVGTTKIGCIPGVTANNSGACVEDLNDLSLRYNNASVKLLKNLSSSTMDGMRYSFVNTYALFSDVISKPSKYNFTNVDTACCGEGSSKECTVDAIPCKNRTEYLFWDYAHPTQAAANLTARTAFYGSSDYTTPINVEKLVG